MADRNHVAGSEPELPLVTIMIPTYGQEMIVLDAVDSALAQDYPNLEVIVADDASPDNTAAIVATRQDSRLRYHRNRFNLGRIANYRNTLYNLANGEWVVNLDGDDYFTDSGFIGAAVAIALREPGILVVMAHGRELGTSRQRKAVCADRLDIVPGTQLLYEIAFRNRLFFHFAALYRRREALRSGFFHIDTLSSDLESLCRLAIRGNIAFLNRDVGVWRTTGNSASKTRDWERLLADIDVWPSVIREAVDSGMMPSAFAGRVRRRIITVFAYSNLSQLIMAGEWLAAKQYVHGYLARYGLAQTAHLATRWRLFAKVAWRCLSGASSCRSAPTRGITT
jgi:glycosyltransferase involved in cell wall biosynthesis